MPSRKKPLPTSIGAYGKKQELPHARRDSYIDDLTDHKPHINLRYFDPDYECFSAWNDGELGALSKFIDTIRETSWQNLLKQGGKSGNKTGFGPTKLTFAQMPHVKTAHELSEDLTFLEMRVGLKARVFGFRQKNGFFLMALDRNHKHFNK